MTKMKPYIWIILAVIVILSFGVFKKTGMEGNMYTFTELTNITSLTVGINTAQTYCGGGSGSAASPALFEFQSTKNGIDWTTFSTVQCDLVATGYNQLQGCRVLIPGQNTISITRHPSYSLYTRGSSYGGGSATTFDECNALDLSGYNFLSSCRNMMSKYRWNMTVPTLVTAVRLNQATFTCLNGYVASSPNVMNEWYFDTCTTNQWSPSASEVCAGAAFDQKSNCNQVRSSIGEKTDCAATGDLNGDGIVSDSEFPVVVSYWKLQTNGVTDTAFPGIVNRWRNQN